MGPSFLDDLRLSFPSTVDELGHYLEAIRLGIFNDTREGSRWSCHSKFSPGISFEGKFYVDADINMGEDDPYYQTAKEASEVFSETTERFFTYCDEGKFNPEFFVKLYSGLDVLLQEGFAYFKKKKRKEAQRVYERFPSFLSEQL